MKSSMFYLWLVTGILGYGSKIPIVKKIIGLLSLWYGKTTIWKILIKLRKLFVIFNALIGMMVVFKTTGFGVDTFWAHFSAMGTEYAIIFKNFVSRLFNWLLGLFDSKIVPNVPTNKPSNPSTYGWWTPRGIDYSWNMPLPKYDNPQALEWVKNPFQINHIQSTPWYKDWSTILWVGGVLGFLGLGYCGYKLFTDPLWVASFGNHTNNNNINPGNIQNNQGDIDPGDAVDPSYTQSFINVTKSLGFGVWRTYSGVRTALNPFYWFATASNLEQQSELFIARQSSLTDAMDNRYYPFTEIHPYRPWYHRIRILTLGESVLENQERLRLRDHILRDATAVTLEDTRSLGSMTPATTIGVGVKPVGVDFTGMLEASQTWSKIKSVSSTPNVVPSTSTLPEFMGGDKSWDTHKIIQSEIEDYVAESKTIKGKVQIETLSTQPSGVETTVTNIESSSDSSSGVTSPNVTQPAVDLADGVAGNISGDSSSVHSAVENNSNTLLETNTTASTTLETAALESSVDDYFLDPLFADNSFIPPCFIIRSLI
jgi:hypothetical protein